MNIPVMEKWIAFLRSEEYKQGQKALRPTDDTYCCLGVLCELAVKEGIIPPPTIRVVPDEIPEGGAVADGKFEYGDDESKSYGVLPEAVAHWAGIYVNPIFSNVQLSTANDNGTTFPEIADLIQGEVTEQLVEKQAQTRDAERQIEANHEGSNQ